MRTVNKVGGANGTIFTEFYGNTTDVKPTEDVPNGSAFYEINNNMQEYRFDKENKIWYLITRGGTAPSGDYLPLSGGIMTGDINMNGNSLLNAKSITLKDETGEYTVTLNLVHLETTNPETVEPFSYEAIEFSNSDDTSKQYVITGVADPLSDTDVVNLRYLGNNYIPLTGTKENKPVTGSIVVSSVNEQVMPVIVANDNTDINKVTNQTIIANDSISIIGHNYVGFKILGSSLGVNDINFYSTDKNDKHDTINITYNTEYKYLNFNRFTEDKGLIPVLMRGADTPVENNDIPNKKYVDDSISNLSNTYIPLTGTTEDNPVTGVVTFNGESTITGVSTPVNDTDVVTKKYADDIKTELDDKTNQIKEDTTALQKRQNVLVGSETGNPVSVDDAFSSPLCGLTIYGKSTQDGTPSPDAPVPIVSAGEDGSVTVKVTGRNILDMRNSKESVTNSGVTYTRNADYSFTRTGTATEVTGNVWIVGDYLVKPKADLSNVFCVLLKGVKYSIKDCVLLTVSPTGNVLVARNENFVPTQDMYITGVKNEDFIKGETYNDIVYPAVYVGEKALQYEPYREQLLTIPTPNGLPGIPVTSGGNYTDENGQQWVCDEVDLERGKYTQRVAIESISGGWNLKPSSVMSGKFWQDKLTNTFQNGAKTAVCNIASFNIWGDPANDKYVFALNVRGIYFSPPKDAEITVEELNAKLNSLSFPVVAVGELANPIERDLTPEEIVAYKALTAYGPDTVVQATDGVGLKLNYQRDVNIVIKNLEYAIASMTTT